ncbi:MAG: hypothetical protein LBT89_08135 [Planctomycetaceae bacterium]|jgi:hypothetical protein|nr:hypothetical protein [Planctomycetaceae bacterium]
MKWRIDSMKSKPWYRIVSRFYLLMKPFTILATAVTGCYNDVMERVAWHPAFVQAIQLELAEYKDVLEYESEYQLTSEPLKIDVLIIKKRSNVVIKKNIGQIFKQCNVVEYKSPDDRFTIWDYHKTQCYSRLYASQHKIGVDEMTVTAVVLRTPRKLLRELGKCFNITNPTNGIYYVNGDTSPTQIVVSADLAEEDNLWLRSLRNDLDAAGMDRVITQQEHADGKLSVEAYLQVILKANPFTFQEIQDMRGKTFDEVMEEAGVTAKWVNRGFVLGEERGIALGEERGIALGEERGAIREKANAVITVLFARFQSVPKTIQDSIKSYTDLIALDSLLEAAATCESIKDFRQNLVR